MNCCICCACCCCNANCCFLCCCCWSICFSDCSWQYFEGLFLLFECSFPPFVILRHPRVLSLGIPEHLFLFFFSVLCLHNEQPHHPSQFQLQFWTMTSWQHLLLPWFFSLTLLLFTFSSGCSIQSSLC